MADYLIDMNDEANIQSTSKRGFAGMDPSQQKKIASKGGKSAHKKGTAHEWNSNEAKEAGRRGGQK